jgi:hypothetical protein
MPLHVDGRVDLALDGRPCGVLEGRGDHLVLSFERGREAWRARRSMAPGETLGRLLDAASLELVVLVAGRRVASSKGGRMRPRVLGLIGALLRW